HSTHVADRADAHLAALALAVDELDGVTTDAPRHRVCNLGTSTGFSVREVLHAAKAVIGRPAPRAVGPRRAGAPPVLVASNALALEVLAWTPRRSTLEAMIGSAWAWRRGHTARPRR